MYIEVSVAVNYLLSHLYTKLPRRRVDNFGEELERCLLRKLQPHWFTDTSSQDASHRCFQTSGPHTDFIFPEAAISSGLEWSEIQACLPAGLVITIDPGHVACQYGSSESSPVISNSAWGAGNGCNAASLSSSGCSSASSVSSSNGSSGSWSKTKHQVLYSATSRGGNGYNLSAEKEIDAPLNEVSKKQLEDVQTHLATEAALSVLTEPEDVVSSQNGSDHSKTRISNESITSVEDSLDYQDTAANSISCGKNTSTDPTIDSSFLDHSVNTESQAKSDVENQFPFNDFHAKPLRHVDELGELQQFDFHTSQHNPPPLAQPPTTFIQKSTSTPSFTAATFAATKFGSTKLKNQAKRPHRLVSPCDPPVFGYASQLLEAIGQNPLQSSQMPLCDRFMRLNELHRNTGGLYGGHNFGLDSPRGGYFGNYQPLDRSSDLTFNNSGYSSGFMDSIPGMSLYGNSDASSGYGMRSNNLVNNPMWSQFEKIRSEFQLKNSQYLQQQQQQHQQENSSLLNRNPGFGFNNMEGNIAPSRNITAFNTTAPRSALQQADGKYGFGDDLELSQDLHDLWKSQKFTSNSGNTFCWSGDVNKPSLMYHTYEDTANGYYQPNNC
ncbi:Protein Tob1 [Taenia solium]|eukprot:TsM_000999600 transcript=TsM_000999600 gene=TsM_000999600